MNHMFDVIWQRDSAGPPRLHRYAALSLLAMVVLVLGVNWPLLATALQDIPPIWMTAFRLAGATPVVFGLAALTGRLQFPRRADMPVVGSVAIFRLALVFILVFTALRIVPPGRSSVLAWTASLWTVPLAAVFLGERMTRLRWLGLSLGIGGIVVLFEPWGMSWSEGSVVFGHVLLLIAAISNASASVHIRRHKWTAPPLALLPWQLLAATVPVTLLAIAVEGVPTITWTPTLVLIVAYQGLLATAFAIWAQITVLRSLPAVTTNLTLMMIPVVGVISSALLVDERITAVLMAGLILIGSGVAINLIGDRPVRESSPLPESAPEPMS